MAFDFGAWLLGTALKEATTRLLKGIEAKDLVARLRQEIETWAKGLPSSADLYPDALFPTVAPGKAPGVGPSLTALRKALVEESTVPCEETWLAALVERWGERRMALGKEAQPFFLQSEAEATTQLQVLAAKLHRACAQEGVLFQVSALEGIDAIREMVSKIALGAATPESLSDEDARTLAQRIVGFGKDRRMFLIHDYVFGASPGLLATMTEEELGQFHANCLQPVLGNVQVLAKMVERLARERTLEAKPPFVASNRVFPMILNTLVMFAGLAKLRGLMIPTLELNKKWLEYGAAPIDEQFDAQVREHWERIQKCVAMQSDAAPSTDPYRDIRIAIGLAVIGEFPTLEVFRASLQTDLETHRERVTTIVKDVLELIPDELMVVADSKTAFERPELIPRAKRTFDELEALRAAKSSASD